MCASTKSLRLRLSFMKVMTRVSILSARSFRHPCLGGQVWSSRIWQGALLKGSAVDRSGEGQGGGGVPNNIPFDPHTRP